ncbi:hypothetical protein [Synechococcus sp. PCC 6312]|uniref:hypothetical protein n=1 Tax=Synechococcus sp. (strain ATCC 27167 / PCC 6312) TaxID=195253 RepID=UPI001C0FD92C|nr:hypothetical protein [Synechococcus sp. PCC 6312]
MPVYQAVRAMGKHKTPWLRRVITEAAQRELMNPSPSEPIGGLDDVPKLGATTRPGDVAKALPVQKRRGRKPKGDSNE